MNKYFYPIYKTKLKPWIKYWLIKKTSVKPVSGTYTLAQGESPLTITKALKAPIRDLNLYGDCYQEQRAGTNLINSVEYNHGITSNGNITGTNIQYLGIEDYTPVEPNTTYTITFQHNVSGSTLYVGYKDSQGAFISRTSLGKDTKTFTTPENAYYGFFYYYINSGFDTIGGYVMLNAGSEALPYEPYGYKPSPTNPSPVQTITGQTTFSITNGTSSGISIIPLGSIELCKIGEYQDRIYKAPDNKWYLEKNIGKVVLNGSASENWSLNAAAPSVTTKYFQSNVIDGTKMASTTGLCNRFLVTAEGIWTDNGEKMQLHNSADNIRMRINTSIASTVSELQTWLASNNVTLYYVLASAVVTEITDDLLLTILNGLENLETFKGTNEITFSDLSPNISFEYLKEDEV